MEVVKILAQVMIYTLEKSEGDFSHFVGNIDEVSLYNYPLTSGNVTSIYN
jgi:hypothetical protein